MGQDKDIKIMEITLNDFEQFITKMMMKLRQKRSREANHTNTPYGKSQDEIDLDGYGAELAFCKLFNLYPEFTYHARVGGYDCLSHSGHRIDVKNTVYYNGHLLVKSSKKPGESDIYVLMVGHFPTYKIAGFATEQELLKTENLKDFGGYNKPGYAIPQDKLSPIEDIDL